MQSIRKLRAKRSAENYENRLVELKIKDLHSMQRTHNQDLKDLKNIEFKKNRLNEFFNFFSYAVVVSLSSINNKGLGSGRGEAERGGLFV